MSEVRKTEESYIPMWKAYWNAMVNAPGNGKETLVEAKARLRGQGVVDNEVNYER